MSKTKEFAGSHVPARADLPKEATTSPYRYQDRRVESASQDYKKVQESKRISGQGVPSITVCSANLTLG